MTPIPAVGSDRVKFSDPPINEVAASLYYIPIIDLHAQHIGLYWSRIRDRFPRCDQQPAVALGPNDQTVFMEVPGDAFPLPRFWFHSDEHPLLIQVQRNAFMLNWRRMEGENAIYPHYEEVIRGFWEALGKYRSFLADETDSRIDVLQRCELNYINLIVPSDYFQKLDDIRRVLPWMSGLAELSNSGRELTGLQTGISYRLNANLNVDVGVRLGQRIGGEIALGLDIKAYGLPADLSLDGARGWYETAHDAIYKMFLESTSREMQEKLWKPR